MPVIETIGLGKEYRQIRGGRTVAVDGLDLSVPEGGVFGFLGPNGSGKTTTIRCLLGLVKPTRGRCRVLGSDVSHALSEVIARVGAIVESPALFPGFSGRRNLMLLARTYGIGRHQVDEMLERVGLGSRAEHLVKGYSLGMRQRLGIAAALLKDPDLLILDEPANGLDPAGIKEIRELLRALGDEGRTVFVSSHILTEVQSICDRVAILSRGRCVASGSVKEVLANGHGDGLIVKVTDLEAGLRVLHNAGMSCSANGDAIRVHLSHAEAPNVTKALASHGLYLSELRPDEADLESVFLELTRDNSKAAA